MTEEVTAPPKRWVEVMTLRDLHERRHPDNPKGHDVPGIMTSILRYGFGDLPMLCERTGKIAKGHGRLEACELLRDTEDPMTADRLGGILEWDPTAEDWAVPVVRGWASVDDVELMAYMIADNKYTEAGGWLTDILFEQAKMIAATAQGLAGTGFSDEEWKDMLGRMSAPPSLDELAALHGDPNPTDMWPALRFIVPPDLRDMYADLRNRWLGDEEFPSVEAQDTEMFRRLLTAAAMRKPSEAA
jgi:hypothetical protein